MERVKLVYRSGADYLLRYCVRNTETGVVGVYSVWGNERGDYGADRDSHHPVTQPRRHQTVNAYCEFLGGPGCCDGSSAGLYTEESERWREARSLASTS